ncbi:hypothetical protein FRC01_002769 [Tulasnella sp. 417]|nr:hypothetical protein FRC01_002769 [Tulasnella sp. 417]
MENAAGSLKAAPLRLGGPKRLLFSVGSERRQYLERCFSRPENFMSEINRIVVETIIKLTYGRLEDERGTDYIKINTYVTDVILRGFQGYVVDLFPALQYLPAWLPGMKFKRDAAQWKREINELEDTVLESAKASTLSDDPDVRGSFMYKKLLELWSKYEDGKNPQAQAEDETMLARSGLTFFVGKFSGHLWKGLKGKRLTSRCD